MTVVAPECIELPPNEDERERVGSPFERKRVLRVFGEEGGTRVAASEGLRRENVAPVVVGEAGESLVGV